MFVFILSHMKKELKIIQSQVLTAAKYDFSVYEKRIMYRILEHLQNELKGISLTERCIINEDLFGDRRFIMPISEFLTGEGDKNHRRVKQALIDLRNKGFEYEDESIWEYLGIIERPLVEKYKESVEFTVTPKLYECFLNFAKGYKQYEINTVFQFESIYAMRFYELLAGQKSKISYSILKLKEMFMLEDKYSRPSDFIKRVVDVAKKELDKKSPYSFIYKTNKDETGGRAIHTIHLYPYITTNADQEEEKNKLKKLTSPAWELDKQVLRYLMDNFGFQTKDLKNNIDLLVWADKEIDLINFLSERKRYITEKAKSPVGYIIGTLKNEQKKHLNKGKMNSN